MKPFILIVDDEYGFADVVSEMLQERGYDVAIAINGKLALEVLATRVADLVLTDMMMPVLDGPELIQLMRADSRYQRIPVILMTALPEGIGPDVKLDALLVKPFSFHTLQEAIDKLIGPAKA